MVDRIGKTSYMVLDPAWLLGPVLDKELRVASRQRRSYLLRFAYVAILTLFVVGVWLASVSRGSGGSVVYQMSRAGVAGRSIVTTVVWFQFITAQLIAAALLSDAINGEVRKRTLGVLAVTPITGLQIVVGKLAGRSVQVGLLLAASLPLLAVVRVFGGVPWDYVVSGLALTLSTAIFAGALSLFFSAFCQHSYTVLLPMLGCYWVLFAGFDSLLEWLAALGWIATATAQSVALLTNPFALLMTRTREMLLAQASTGPSSRWLFHCLVMLAISSVVLVVSAWRVRRTAVLLTGGPAAKPTKHTPRQVSVAPGRLDRYLVRRRPMTPRSSPILWKELHRSWLPRHRAARLVVGIVVVMATLVLIVTIAAGDTEVAGAYMSFLYFAFLVRLATAAAGGISGEREGRTLPILLTTPLENKEIVKGKALAAFYRNLPILAAVLLLYLLASLSHPPRGANSLPWIYAAGLHVVTLLGLVLFLLGLGLYCSVRLKTTAAAVTTTFAVCFGLMFLSCGGFGFLFGLGSVLMGKGMLMWGGRVVLALLPALIYGSAGVSFLRAAVWRLRRNID